MFKHLIVCVGLPLMLVRTAAAQQGNAADFVPAVTVDDTVATCAAQLPDLLQPDEQGFVLRFGSDPHNPKRVVAAAWDTSGHLRRYSDARGDLRGPPVAIADRGARTTIIIDVVKGMALLLNESRGRSFGSMMASPNDALVAERLGPPKRILERMHTQCGAPAT